MALNHLSSYRCVVFAIVATRVLGTAVFASSDANQMASHDNIDAQRNHPWQKIGPAAACKEKEDDDMCEYSPRNITHNYLFWYSHDQHLKRSIKKVLESRGFAESDYHDMLVIKSRTGKILDASFLAKDDIFDGQVSPNDFPVKMFLKETWKGKCRSGACVGVRSPLYDACDNQPKGESCTYASLKLEKSRLKGVLPFGFEGKCEIANEGVPFCKLSTKREQQIEACLGQLAGKACEYSLMGTGYDDVYKGRCRGANKGKVLYCGGGKAASIDACEDKVRGDDCLVKGASPWKGWCGYADLALQCMNEKNAGPEPEPEPEPSPEPEPEPEPSSAVLKKLDSMQEWDKVKADELFALLGKMASKMGVPLPSPPTSKPSNRRRRRGKPSTPTPTSSPTSPPTTSPSTPPPTGSTRRRRRGSRRRKA